MRAIADKTLATLVVGMSAALADPARTRELLTHLSRASIELLGASATVVLEIDVSGAMRVAASEEVGCAIVGFDIDRDASGPELAAEFVRALGGGLVGIALPLASGGDLFGWWLLAFPSTDPIDDDGRALADALVELVATGLGRAAHVRELQRYTTEIRASRDALAQSQKLRMLGEMAAGISHDLKNILAPLSLHLQFIQRAVPKDNDDAQESLMEMRDVVRRGVETIDRLRSFSRQAPVVHAVEVRLDDIAREAVRLCMPRLRANVDLRATIVAKLAGAPPALLNATDALSAIVNLIVNAIDAIGTARGTVEVATGEREGGAWIRVADDGPGMSAEVQQRVFEPFFTTKGAQGTGLGLAMVFAFVQRHRGEITLDSAPGKGAAFTLWFPPPGRDAG